MTKWKQVHKYLMVALFVLLAINLFLAMSSTKKLMPIPVEPQILSLTTITVDCDECFDVRKVTTALKEGSGMIIEEETLAWEDAGELITKYSIERLPAVIVNGQVIDGMDQVEGSSVFQSPPPYKEASTRKLRGIVDATILTAGCEECTDMNDLVSQLTQAQINFGEIKSIPADEGEGKLLVDAHNIDTLPSIVLSEEAGVYEFITEVWSEVGTSDTGAFVLRKIPAPYVKDGRVHGLVELTLLKDDTCVECYNVTLHQALLTQNFGMKFQNVEYVDVGSTRGKRLVSKYDIDKVPTYQLDKEAGAYELLDQLWGDVGSIEDGVYTFRKVEELGIAYKDLKNGTVIQASS